MDIVCFRPHSNKRIIVVCSFPFSLWVLSALTCLLAVLWEAQKSALLGSRVAAREASDRSALHQRERRRERSIV